MAYELSAKHPFCGIVISKNLNKLEKFFGFLTMKNGSKIPQSYCRNCRGLHCSPNNKKCQ